MKGDPLFSFRKMTTAEYQTPIKEQTGRTGGVASNSRQCDWYGGLEKELRKGSFERAIPPSRCAEILREKGSAQVLTDATLKPAGLK